MILDVRALIRRFVSVTTAIAVALSLGAAIAVVGCVHAGGGRTDSEAVDWAGFNERDGLAIVAAEDVGRMDAAVEFTLKGSNGDITAAISSSGFKTGFAPGTDQVQASLFDGKLDGLTDIESATDTWKAREDDLHPHVQTIHRHLVKGRQGDDVVLHVSAFTT
jgi:hypothetical protein